MSTRLSSVRTERSQLDLAIDDVVQGLRDFRIWWTRAKFDISQRYKRSVIGPFWLTITMAVYILGVGPVYGTLFKMDLHAYLPHLALGLVIWGLFTTILLDSCLAFSSQRNMLISTKMPYTVYIMRVVVRTAIIFLHNMVAVVPFLIYLKVPFTTQSLLFIPGLLLMLLVSLPCAYILSVLCTRFRDLQPIVASVIQLFFFLTPILWSPEHFDKNIAILRLNPFWWLMEIVRGPLLGDTPDAFTYSMVGVLLVLLVAIAVVLFVRFRRRLAFWI